MNDDTSRRQAAQEAARDWTMILDSQRGIVATAQTRQVGIPIKAVRHRLESGRWRRLHQGVYATFTGEIPREAKLWAALKRAGEGAMLSHETAGELHGLTVRPGRTIHITVSHSRRPAQRGPIRGVVIHRSDVSRPQPLPEWLLPRTRIEDTVLDLVATAATFDDAYAWVSRAVAERLVTVGMLRSALEERKRMRWRDWLTDALADAEDGAHFPWSAAISEMSNAPMGCRKLSARHAARSAGGRITRTTCMKSTASALRSTGRPITGANGGRRTKTATTSTWPPTASRPSGSAPST